MSDARKIADCGVLLTELKAHTRLWPLSRSGFPKQFLCLTGIESLFQLAAKRVEGKS